MVLSSLELDALLIAPLACWLCLELAFWMYVRHYLSPSLNAHRVPPKSLRGARDDMEVIFRHVVMMRDHYPMERFISGWLGGASIKDIKHDNIKETLAWVVYSAYLEDLSEPQMEFVSEAVSVIISCE